MNFYVEIERTQVGLIEINAASKEDADVLAGVMSDEQMMDAVDDWDWDGNGPIPTGLIINETELLNPNADDNH